MPENRPPSPPPEAHAAQGAVSDVATSSPSAAGTIVYEVKPGDNLTRIAKKHKCTVSEILKLNKMKPNKVLWVGLKLKIPAPVE
jgi:LysM repeat protein